MNKNYLPTNEKGITKSMGKHQISNKTTLTFSLNQHPTEENYVYKICTHVAAFDIASVVVTNDVESNYLAAAVDYGAAVGDYAQGHGYFVVPLPELAAAPFVGEAASFGVSDDAAGQSRPLDLCCCSPGWPCAAV